MLRKSCLTTMFCISDITVLLSLTVFHNIVTDTLPQTSIELPIIGTGALSFLDGPTEE